MTLIYHDVRPQTTHLQAAARVADWYTLTPEAFSSHLDTIETAASTPAVLGERVPADRLFLTFDDGEISAIDTVAPMLEARGWRGHFFVVTARIGTPGFVGADDVRALAARGHVVGSHSHTHPVMTELDDAAIRDEWRTSREILEQILGEEVSVASVPTGHYVSRIGRLALEAGYRHVFTSEPWLEPRAVDGGTIYGRFMVRRDTTPEAVAAVCSFSRPAVMRQRMGWEMRKVLKRTMGSRYEDLRRALIARL